MVLFLNIIQTSETLSFLGSIGLVFLMFIAGTEIKISALKNLGKKIIFIAFLGGIIPGIIGFLIGLIFNYHLIASSIIGIIFISSAIAVIIPSLESNNIIKTDLGKAIISSVVLLDFSSLLFLSLIIQFTNPKATVPLYLFFPIIIFLALFLKFIVPKMESAYKEGKLGRALFESELRFIVSILLLSVIIFSSIGLHSILAGFITGVILADSIKGRVSEKIRTLSYGLFIPVFFVMLGVEINLSIFSSIENVLLVISIIFGLIISKIFSGWLGARIAGFNNKASIINGISMIPQLSASLAAAYAAFEFNIISPELMASFIFLSIITTLISPILLKKAVDFSRKTDYELKK